VKGPHISTNTYTGQQDYCLDALTVAKQWPSGQGPQLHRRNSRSKCAPTRTNMRSALCNLAVSRPIVDVFENVSNLVLPLRERGRTAAKVGRRGWVAAYVGSSVVEGCASADLVEPQFGRSLGVRGQVAMVRRAATRAPSARHFHEERKSVESRYAVRSQRAGGLR
jgi:hypothetical protein